MERGGGRGRKKSDGKRGVGVSGGGGGGGFGLACENFVRMFDYSFPTSALLLLLFVCLFF